jgi:hypothetical protein
MENSVCIGLFGTCNGSRWREEHFYPTYTDRGLVEGINFYNPQVEDWKPEDAVIEAEHLANDQVILFPVTCESYGIGSLAEVGFSILNAIRLDDRRDFIIMIQLDLLSCLKEENPSAAKESQRARALVSQHLKKIRLGNLYVVDTFDEMLELSLTCYKNHVNLAPYKRFNPHNR